MSRCYLDTNYLYVVARADIEAVASPVREWIARVERMLAESAGVVSPLVFDELAYRLLLAWLRDEGDADPLSTYRTDAASVSRRMRRRLEGLWSAVDDLPVELAVTDQGVVDEARRLMIDPGFSPRDAFHAAHAVAARCDVIVSADAAFDALTTIARIGLPT